MKLILSLLCLVAIAEAMSITRRAVGCMLPRPIFHDCKDEPSRDPPPSSMFKKQESVESHMRRDDGQGQGNQQNQSNNPDAGELEYDHQGIDQGQTYPKQRQGNDHGQEGQHQDGQPGQQRT